MTNRLIQHITVEEATSTQWVKQTQNSHHPTMSRAPEIRRGIKDNSKIIFSISCCEPSIEVSRRDGSIDGSRYMFFMELHGKLSKNYPCYFFLSGALNKNSWKAVSQTGWLL